ncbi:cation:dicarboxylase symporter family transporter [Sphingomonas sp. LY29]|uniref:dicarboxylate/amino acid:cation symporter n=1 Tax=Sphingomonas sp. LY29 TaxID=3095341 RepID=UPI002D76A71C|nr:cation:dicarboxylase symporter family transporter [Sphingomonas sp. LY29]WRP26466.1 cation:dicarboxylase symporter family transporter [Sphingomonas sp. LY29]
MTDHPTATKSAAPVLSGAATWRILVALIVGLALGALTAGSGDGWREPAVQAASTIGGMWLDALKMTVVPLIVALLVTGIVAGAEHAEAGGIARRSLIWFVVILTASAIFGALLTPLLLDVAPLPADAAEALRAGLASVDSSAAQGAVPKATDLLRSFIPSNVVTAAADGAILGLVTFSLLFAFAITKLAPARRRLLGEFFAAVADALLVVIGWVLWIAPIGVFALAFAVGAGAGAAAFGAVLHYVIIVSLVGIAVIAMAYLIAIGIGRFRLSQFARAMLPPQAVAISTQSSLASLPAMIVAAKTLGVKERSTDITLPMAVALFRPTGPAMNIAVAIYVAHWLGIELSVTAIIAGIVVAATTTYGAVSLPGQLSFITSIAPISIAMGLPIEPLAILVAVETIPDIFRTVGNVTMDVAVTGGVSRGERRPDADAEAGAGI